jgi:hypothetical protein
MANLMDKATEVNADPEARLVWMIVVGAAAGLVAIAYAFRS